MSTAGYKRECEEAVADAATKLEITAQAKLRAVEPDVVAAVAPELARTTVPGSHDGERRSAVPTVQS